MEWDLLYREDFLSQEGPAYTEVLPGLSREGRFILEVEQERVSESFEALFTFSAEEARRLAVWIAQKSTAVPEERDLL